jgi:hypothetical protein
MKTNTSKSATGATFYGFRAVAISLALVILGISLGAVVSASGQYQRRTYARTDVERFIRDVELSSQDFDRDFDSWLGRSSTDPGHEDVYNRDVHDLIDALTTLRSNFNRRNDWWLARIDMQRVLSAATNINSLMSSREVRGSGLNRQWSRLRTNINTLANAFNLPQVGTTFGGIQTYPDSGGNYRACTITGTFRGYTNSGEAELSFSSNGTATARSLVNGAVYNGRCANDVVYFEWGSFNIVREGRNNVTLSEIGNQRNRVTYRRVGGGYSGDVVPTYPTDQYGNVPSWAVGTFRGTSNRSGESEITITPNGVATARSLNSQDIGSGRYANGVITFDWGTFRVDQEGDGIRLVEVRNSRNQASYRRVSGYTGDVIVPTYPTDQYGNVPGWAVGTFRCPGNDGESDITISANGMATARSLNNGAVFNGRYANSVLTFDWGSFRVDRENGGIRTVELNNQQNRTCRRIN